MVAFPSRYMLAVRGLLFSLVYGQSFGVVEGFVSTHTVHAETQVEAVFRPGPFAVTSFTLPADASADACAQLRAVVCKPTTIHAPQQAGDYPVVLFQHGYVLETGFYSQLLDRVASFGYIVVAPQMYPVPKFGLPRVTSDATQEILDAVVMLRWSQTYLNDVLADKLTNVTANTHHTAVAGHSRGGKVAAGVAVNISSSCSGDAAAADSVCRQPPLQAVALLDPVDGNVQPGCCPKGCPTLPYLTQQRLALGAPLLVVGTSLGQGSIPLINCPCAPAKFGFEAFFNQSSSEGYSFVAEKYGHLDMLDDKVHRFNIALLACVAGKKRQPMRDFSAGLLVAFLQAKVTRELDFTYFVQQLADNAGLAPVAFRAQQRA